MRLVEAALVACWIIMAALAVVLVVSLFACSIEPQVTVEKPIVTVDCVEVIVGDKVSTRMCEDAGEGDQ